MPAEVLDWSSLRAVAGMADRLGVLSIYVTLDPRGRAEPAAKPPWELRLRHQLAQVREQAGRETGKALTARLEQLRLDLERLLDPAATGQGRAMFTGLADGQVRTISLQVPLGDRVVLEPYAYLRPLLTAWSTAGPAGAVAISADGLRLVDLRFGWAEEVGAIGYEPPVEQRELKGPGPSGLMGLAPQGAPQHDLYERREDDKLLRFLRTTGPHLADQVKQREWGFLVLTGDAALVQAVQDGLPPTMPAQLVALDHPVNSLPAPRLAEVVGPALADARARHHRELAQRARGNALAANTGAYGLGETLGALQQGRAAHLLLAADGQWTGGRGPDGFLAPRGEIPPGADPATVTTEPHLGERMIELALRHNAEVTLLDPAAAALLADADGVGAILRW